MSVSEDTRRLAADWNRRYEALSVWGKIRHHLPPHTKLSLEARAIVARGQREARS